MWRNTIMAQYEKLILNQLLDSYENSSLFTGENKVKVSISFPFQKKRIPEYFNESSTGYEDIHACVRDMEQKNYIRIVWKRGKENHIIEKVLLNETQINQIYSELNRKPKADKVLETITLLGKLQVLCDTPISQSFLRELQNRIETAKSVAEYINLDETKTTEQLVKAITYIEKNEKECYIREFSISQFSDSKLFESLLGKVAKVMRDFEIRFQEMDIYEILAEYAIYHTPNFVYFKGDALLQFDASEIDLRIFKNGIGIPGDMLQTMVLQGAHHVTKIITIENLTTFFRWSESGAVILYLGGYHNAVRREFLKQIYKQIPNASYLHFGDIDVGGFEIYEDLCKKTGIPFETYYMDIAVLKEYQKYAKDLTENDKKRILKLLEKKKNTSYETVLHYMLDKYIKLEQECIIQNANRKSN